MTNETTGTDATEWVDDEPEQNDVPQAVNGGAEAIPDWAKQGTTADDDDIALPVTTGAKAMGPREEWIPAAKSVRFEITKAVIEKRGPKGGEWKFKQMNVYLKVADGIVYPPKGGGVGRNAKPGEKGMFKGKIFFHRFGVAINPAGTDAKGNQYDFTVNAQGKPSQYYAPGGMFWGELNELLGALGLPTDGTVRNNKAFREGLVGRFIIYDIEKEAKESYDSKTNKRTKIPGEFENKLYCAAAAGASSAGKGAAVPVPAAIPEAPANDDAPWESET